MSHFDHTLQVIEDGLRGMNEGLYHGLPRAIRYMPNIQKGNIYLIGGISGAGKSALATDIFVMNAYEDYKRRLGTDREVKLKIFMWSIEISPEILVAKSICRRLWKDHGILTDTNYILSRGDRKLNNTHYELIKGYKDYYAELEDRVIINSKDNPTGIRNTLLDYLHNKGTIKHKKVVFKFRDRPDEEKEVFDRYVPDDERLHIIGVIDHLSIMKIESRAGVMFNKKQNIDKMMEYCLDLVRDFKVTMVPLQQLNRASEQTDRVRLGNTDPLRSDFKETSDSTDLAHVIIGLCYPQSYNVANYMGYKMDLLGDRFRGIKFIKNRDGNADIVIGTRFLGEVGEFKELPLPARVGKLPAKGEMTLADYEAIKNITKFTA